MPSPRGPARCRRPRLLLLALLAFAPACAADRNAAADADSASPPSYESRVGVPLLMDLPLIGFLFSRRTVRR